MRRIRKEYYFQRWGGSLTILGMICIGIDTAQRILNFREACLRQPAIPLPQPL